MAESERPDDPRLTKGDANRFNSGVWDAGCQSAILYIPKIPALNMRLRWVILIRYAPGLAIKLVEEKFDTCNWVIFFLLVFSQPM